MFALIYGQVLTQLGWTLGVAAAPFLALSHNSQREVVVGVLLLQLVRLLPLVWPGLSRRLGWVLVVADVLAAGGFLLAVAAGFAPLAYLGAGLAGVLEGWLIPVLLREVKSGVTFDRANGLSLAIAAGTPVLAWPAIGAWVTVAGPVPALRLGAVLLGFRALLLLPYVKVQGRNMAIAAPRLDGRLYLVFFLLVFPLGTFSTRLPGVLGPRSYALYNQLFSIGSVAGALLGGSRLLGLAASATFLAVGGLTLAGGAFLPGGGFYGLGFGALQAAGMSWLSRRLRGAPFAAALARFGAAGALGGAAGALLAGTPLWILAIPAGLLLTLFAFRAQTPT